MILEAIGRLVRNSSLFNTLNTRKVEIVLQKSPGKPGTDKRGIKDLEWQVSKNGVVIQTGKTADDGKVKMRVRGGSSILQWVVGTTTVVAEYTVRIRDTAMEAVTDQRGQLRRLRVLGYQIGHSGADGIGVDSTNPPPALVVEGDRAILQFQTDEGIKATGTMDANTRTALTNAAGA
jgi:hypothetical protein